MDTQIMRLDGQPPFAIGHAEMLKRLHVFAGSFESREPACCYIKSQWEREPGDSASDEEDRAWEDRNFTWPLRSDLSVYLESDSIETIDEADRFEYLSRLLVEESDVEAIRESVGDSNTLVLICPDALGGFKSELKSTAQLHYCGSFRFRLT